MTDVESRFNELAVIIVVLIVTVAVIGMMVMSFGGAGADDERILLDADGEGQTLELDDEAYDVTLKDSTGYGLALAARGGSVSAPADVDIETGATITTYAALDEEAATWRDYHLLSTDDGEIIVQFVDEEWVACADIDDESACVSDEAADPYELTLVGAIYDDEVDEISLAVDGEIVDTAALEENGDEPHPTDTWFGTVDELRVIDQTASESDIAELADDPFAPQLDGEISRLMFDEGAGDETHVLFKDETATLDDGADWADGVEGNEIPADEFVVDEDDGSVTLLEDTRVSNLPVVFASWGGGPLTEFAGDAPATIGTAFVLGAIATIVLVAAVILRTLNANGARLR